MNSLKLFVGVLAMTGGTTSFAADKPSPPTLAFKMKTLAGQDVDLKKYDGKVVLFVNVASECGLTGQYTALQAIHKKYSPQGLAVVGVPCNQFGSQEPGTSEQIAQFCKENYGVDFDMLAKVDVNGAGACPLYKHLTKQATKPKGAGEVGWNFEKFLLDRQGNVIGRFDPDTTPDSDELVGAIEGALKK